MNVLVITGITLRFCYNKVQEGFPHILSERFCQNDLENYFKKQRAIGRRFDDLAVCNFGYNDNSIKSQFSVSSHAGNVQGPVRNFNEMCNEPLPKN